MATIKVLMVCLGNICRSPLAEGILKSKVNHQKIMVDSAGTSATHKGEKPDTRSIKIAKDHGIDITYQRARQFKVSDFETFDYIYVMDAENYRSVLQMSPSKEASNKVKMILNCITPKVNAEVPDPYYGGASGFQNVFDMLDLACATIANELNQHANS